MTKNSLLTFSAVITSAMVLPVMAQQNANRLQTRYHAEAGGIVSSSSRTPFWLRANQYGVVPLSSPTGFLRLGTHATLRPDSSLNKKWSLGYGAEVVANGGRVSEALVPEAYVTGTLGKFYAYAGRRREVIGLGDSTLSSGFYAWSQNALPITKVQIGTNGFVPLGFTKGLIAINALYAHGWFPATDSMRNSFLHQKALYGRLGKPNWKIKLYGGIVHNAQWGGRSDFIPNHSRNGRLPSSFRDYLYVVSVRQPNTLVSDDFTAHDGMNRFGNHLGSIDLGIEWSGKFWNGLFYYQHAFEDKSGTAFKNGADGLFGLRLKNGSAGPVRGFRFRQLLVEYLTTKNQGGMTMNVGNRQFQGLDDYFNNFQYLDGWTRRRQTIGTPFITPRREVQADLQNPYVRPYSIWTLANNRVDMLHLALMGEFTSGLKVQSRVSMSRNYGLYRVPFRTTEGQFSGMLGLTWPLRFLGGSELQTAIAYDQGGLLPPSTGGWLSLRKSLGR